MGDAGRFIVGAAAIGASFIPGVGPLVSTALLGFGISSVTGAGIAALSSRDVEREYENRATTTRPLHVVYGKAKVGGNTIEAHVADASAPFVDPDFLGKIVAFAVASEDGSGIEDVTAIWVDEILAVSSGSDFNGDGPVFADDQQGVGVKKFFENHLEYSLHDGSDDQNIPVWAQNRFGGDRWSNKMKGVGIAHGGFALEHDTTVYPGVPNITFEVKGNRVYDPRSGSWAWSDNPALCLLDYLTSARYGVDVNYPERDADGSFSEIDEQSFIDGANYCDELVAVPDGSGGTTTQKRFTANVAIPTGDHKKAIQTLKACMRGEVIYQGGKYRLVIRRPTAPVDLILDEDNIVGEWEWAKAGTEKAPNTVRASFVNEDADYQADEVVWPRRDESNPYLTSDNDFPSEMEIDLRGVTNPYRARQIAMTALKEARADISVQVTCTEAALQLQVGDVVRITHNTPGWTEKPFWVAGVGIHGQNESGLTVRLALQEYDGSAFVLEEQDDEPDKPDSDPPRFIPEGPIDVDLIGAWQLGFAALGGECSPPEICAATNCLCADCDPRRTQIDLSGRGNPGTITIGTGFKASGACYAPGPAGVSYETNGGHHVNVPGSLTDSTLQLSNPEDGDGFTVMAWFYSTTNNALTAAFGQAAGGPQKGWSAEISNDGSSASFGYFGENGGGGSPEGSVDIEAALGRKVGLNEWVHLALAVHPVDENNDFVVDFLINGQWIASRTMAGGPIVPADSNATLGWGAERGDNPNITRIVGRMNLGLIYDGALSRQDVAKIHSGEFTTPDASVDTIDQIGDGQTYARIRQEWEDDGRPKDWLDEPDIEVVTNDTCADGGGLQVTLRPDYTSLGESDEGDVRVFVDWWEDGSHVKQESTTNVWNNITGGTVNFHYTDGSTGSDASDASEHHIVARLILMDITGSRPVALDSKSVAIRATYGTNCP